jgi:hypothetical protein
MPAVASIAAAADSIATAVHAVTIGARVETIAALDRMTAVHAVTTVLDPMTVDRDQTTVAPVARSDETTARARPTSGPTWPPPLDRKMSHSTRRASRRHGASRRVLPARSAARGSRIDPRAVKSDRPAFRS